MPVRINVTGEVLTAYLEGEIDHHSAVDLRNEIDHAIEKHMPSVVILDFRDVTFMDSSGIGLVMGRYKLLKSTNAELHITNTSPQIGKVMKIAGLERLAKFDKGEKTNETK